MFISDIIFYLSPSAVALGAKVSLVNGQYIITKAAATTIQAVNGGVPPADQAAEVAALTAQVAQLEADLAACQAGGGLMPTISGMTVQPANLPAGGGNVVVDATVTGAATLTLDGAPVTLPATVPVTADHVFTLVATGGTAQATAGVVVAGAPPKPTISNMTVTPSNLPVGGGQVIVDATVVGATSINLLKDGVDQGPVTLPVTITVT